MGDFDKRLKKEIDKKEGLENEYDVVQKDDESDGYRILALYEPKTDILLFYIKLEKNWPFVPPLVYDETNQIFTSAIYNPTTKLKTYLDSCIATTTNTTIKRIQSISKTDEGIWESTEPICLKWSDFNFIKHLDIELKKKIDGVFDICDSGQYISKNYNRCHNIEIKESEIANKNRCLFLSIVAGLGKKNVLEEHWKIFIDYGAGTKLELDENVVKLVKDTLKLNSLCVVLFQHFKGEDGIYSIKGNLIVCEKNIDEKNIYENTSLILHIGGNHFVAFVNHPSGLWNSTMCIKDLGKNKRCSNKKIESRLCCSEHKDNCPKKCEHCTVINDPNKEKCEVCENTL